MNCAPRADDYIIATGETHSLMELIEDLCRLADLDPANLIKTDKRLLRPSDLSSVALSADKIRRELNWNATTSFSVLVGKLYNRQLF